MITALIIISVYGGYLYGTYISYKNIIDNDELKHEISLFAKANIDGVITTNWDVFLESLFPKEGANKSEM